MTKAWRPFADQLSRRYSRVLPLLKKSTRSHSLSKGLVEKITDIFKPQAPLWACELTPKHIIIAGVNNTRNAIRAKTASELPPDAVASSYTEPNIRNADLVRSTVKQLLNEAG